MARSQLAMCAMKKIKQGKMRQAIIIALSIFKTLKVKML